MFSIQRKNKKYLKFISGQKGYIWKHVKEIINNIRIGDDHSTLQEGQEERTALDIYSRLSIE